MRVRQTLIVPLLFLAAVAHSQQQYSIQFLPTLGGTYNEPLGIGNAGHIVGYSTTLANWGHGYVYSGGAMTEFPPFGGTASSGVSVNALGHVVGESSVSGTGLPHSFIYRNGAMTDLGEIEQGMWTRATGINDTDFVSGYMETFSDQRAFVWHEGVFTELGSLSGGQTVANGINNQGQIVGASGGRPYVYEGGVMTELPSLTQRAEAVAINDAGTIVGQEFVDFDTDHAVVWQGGTITDIGTLGGTHSRAVDVNNLGLVIGSADLADNSQRPFLFASGTMYNLDLLHDQPDWTLASVSGINDSGQIVGLAIRTGTSESAGVVLNPVPEPATLIVLGFSVGMLSLRRRRGSRGR